MRKTPARPFGRLSKNTLFAGEEQRRKLSKVSVSRGEMATVGIGRFGPLT